MDEVKFKKWREEETKDFTGEMGDVKLGASIGSKNFFYKSILNWYKDTKMDFRNRKWNYFTPFQS